MGELDEKSLLLGVLLGILIGGSIGYVLSKIATIPQYYPAIEKDIIRDGEGRIVKIR